MPIRDEVVGEAGGLKRLGRLLERRAERWGSRAAEMRQPRFSAHRQRLVERVVQKDIGVGTSGLHERLDARHIRIERGEVVPPRVPRIELDAGIELPARPRIPDRRVRGAVIHDVVDAGDEEPIDGRPHVGQPHAEMFAEPRRGLGRHQPPSGHVRRGRRPFEPLNLGAFGLGNVARGVQIEHAGRRSVGLIADETALTSGPRRPLGRERLEEQIRDGFAIVREHARAHVAVTTTEERRKVPAEVVAAAFLEFGEEARRPIGLAGRVIDFIGVVEERAKAAETTSRERAIERQQVLSDRVGREMIDDQALTSGRGALDQLAVPAGEEGVQRPAALRGDPVQPPVRLHARREIDGVARLRIGHQHRERQIARILHLLQRERLQVLVGRDRLDEIADGERPGFGPDHRR